MKNFKSYFLLFVLLSIFFSCSEKKQGISEEEKNEKILLIEQYIEKAENEDTDSLKRIKYTEDISKLVNSLKDNLVKRKKLTNLSWLYLTMPDSTKFIETTNHIINLSKKINDSAGLAFNYNRLAIFYKQKDRLDSAFTNYYRADKIYSNLNNEFAYEHGKSLLGMAIIHRQFKDYTESSSLLIKAINRFKSEKNISYNYLSISFNYLGMAANNLGDYDKAIEYHKKSINYSKNLSSQNLKEILAFNNIGIVLKNQKKYNEAIEYYNKALEYIDYLKEDKRRYALLVDNLAYMKFLSGERKNIEESFLESLKIRESIKDKSGISINTLHLAEYYKTLRKDSLAKMYAEKSKNISKSTNYNDNLLESYKLLTELSNKEQGLQYAQFYISLSDSLQNLERLNRDKFARIRFETDQKEQQIIKVQNQNAIYLLGILLLLTAISFALYFYRQRTRYLAQQNKIVQFQASYDTETRISKRLHDELGNDIFQVMLQYQNDPQDPTIPQKLNTTYNKARDISRENSEFETGATYPQELANMLQNYTQNEVQLILRGLDKIEWDIISKNTKITVYRVLQEFMTNMQKHSQATLVALVFSNINNQLEIKYSDNGVGMDESDQKSSNGLRNTEKRIQAINGTLIFTTKKDKGFKAEIQIPS